MVDETNDDYDFELNNEKAEDKNNDVESKKSFFKNVSIVLISNIFSAISGILIGFIVPKFLSVADYGYYKTFTLYSSYIGLLHFGFIDGIFLMYAGKKYEELDKLKFRTYTKFLFILEAIFSGISVLISLFFLNTELFTIFLFVALNILLTNMTSYFEFICQVTMQFKRKSFRKFILCIMNIVFVLVLFVIYHYDIAPLTGIIYIIITLAINLLVLLWYVISFRDIIFGKGIGIRAEKDNILYLLKVGFPLLLTNLVTQFIFVIDQQVINIFFDNETYATYAFAYNMLSVITIATSAVSVVFYPTIKAMKQEKVISDYSGINSALLIFLSFCMFAYFPLEFIVRIFLDKYIDSLVIFKIVLPGVVISSCITSIKYNCYKALNKVRDFFVISVIILALAAISDLVVYFIFKDPIQIAIASIVVLLIWYVVVEVRLNQKFKVSWIKNFIYLLLTVGAYYAISYIPNIYIAMSIYIPVIAAITLVMYFKVIKDLFYKFKNRHKKDNCL